MCDLFLVVVAFFFFNISERKRREIDNIVDSEIKSLFVIHDEKKKIGVII